MTGMQVQVVGNDEGVEQMLHVLDTALNPVAIGAFLGGVVGPFLEGRARSRFANEGDDAVGKWAPLQQTTVDIRESQGYGGAHPINHRTGELEEFITGSGNYTTVHPWGATLQFPGASPIGEMEEKVRTAQMGKSAQYKGGSDTVPRPVLGLSETDLVYVMSALALHIKGTGERMFK